MRVDPYERAPRLPEGPVDPASLFAPAPFGASSGSGRLELEIGPGRGWFILERLEVDPDVQLLGLEIRRKWATIVDERLAKRGLSHRARVFAEDAKAALPRFPNASLSVAYLHFPDPWWKKRHQKRLVLGAELLQELARVLVPAGELFIQTDVPERADEYEALVAESPAFEPADERARIVDHPYGARSPRERKAIEDGLPIVRLRYRRTPASI
jgi:tRNA (guanine-N7-)-methyltransferase